MPRSAVKPSDRLPLPLLIYGTVRSEIEREDEGTGIEVETGIEDETTKMIGRRVQGVIDHLEMLREEIEEGCCSKTVMAGEYHRR